MPNKIRLLIADDHIIVRNGIRLLLENEPDMDIVAEALDGKEAVQLTEVHKPDIVLMDISMPGMDGMEATRQIKGAWPEINILVLTMHRSDEYFFEMLKAGASGYVLKGAKTSDLITAIRLISEGSVFLYPTMAKKLINSYLEISSSGKSDISPLSSREHQVLKLLAEGYSNQEIAKMLVISPSTVHTHRSNLMAKLGLSKRHEIVKYAQENGLL